MNGMIHDLRIGLIPAEHLTSIIPLIKQLNPALTESTLTARLADMVNQGYQCAGVYSGKQLVGVCGFWITTKFYVGKHIEPDNVFVLPEYRRRGLAKRLLNWIYDYGKHHGCIASELNCYVANAAGNAFWEQEGFVKIGYHYQKQFNFRSEKTE